MTAFFGIQRAKANTLKGMAERLKLLHQWLREDLNLSGFSVTPASADASFRRYFRVSWEGQTAIVMDAPPDKENCAIFIDITARLLPCEVNVPKIRASNLAQGFLLIDDLGKDLYLDVLNADNAARLYTDAIGALVRFQHQAASNGLPVYDESLLRQEMTLFSDWLVGRHLQIEITAAITRLLNDVFTLLVNSALEQPRVFVHRDYHSRNLLVNPHNPGIVDYQDAVYGPASYDLVSLLKDCYIQWPRARVLSWLEEFRRTCPPFAAAGVSDEQFLRWFDLMGVQRHLKASGIFARLWHRDNKPGFIGDIPRTLSYILELDPYYPELSPLAGFIRERVMPGLERTGP